MKVYCVIFCLVLLQPCLSQNSGQKEVITHYRMDGSDSVKTSVTTNIYNEKQQLKEVYFEDLEYLYSTVLKYDICGREWYLLEKSEENNDSTIYTYDTNSELVFSETYRNKKVYLKTLYTRVGDTLTIDVYEKNLAGYYQMSKREQQINLAQESKLYFLVYDVMGTFYVQQKTEYVFNETKKVVSMKSYNMNGDPIDTFLYEYMDDLIVKEIFMSVDDSYSTVQFKYEFYEDDKTSWKTKTAFIESEATGEKLIVSVEKRSLHDI